MNLEGDKRLNIQLRLDLSSTPTGEARQAGREDIESLSVVSEPERPANTSRIMEEICERANLKEALRQVRGNKGSAGVDRMTVDQLGDYLKQQLAGYSGAIAERDLRTETGETEARLGCQAFAPRHPASGFPPRRRPSSRSRGRTPPQVRAWVDSP